MEVVGTDGIELKERLLVLGLVGAGLVGQVAVNHIIDQLNMKEIAQVRSRHIPPSVVFMDGKLKHPFRVYSNAEGSLCAVLCDIPLPSEGLYPITSALLDWAEEKGTKELVVPGGIPERRESLCAAEPEKCKECEQKGVKMLTARVLVHAIASSFLSQCLTRKVTGVAFLTRAAAFMPDPEGASTLLNTLGAVYGLKVDTGELLDKAKEIRQKLEEVAENCRRMRRSETRRGSPGGVYTWACHRNADFQSHTNFGA